MIALQKEGDYLFLQLMKFKNIIFDCDSTLVKIEGLDEIARRKGSFGQVKEITEQGMNGGIAYEVSFRKRWLEIVQPTKEDLQWLGEFYIKNLTPGVAEVIARLKLEGINIYILSHVPEPSIWILADHLGLPQEDAFAVPVDFGYGGVMTVEPKFLAAIEGFKNGIIKKIRTTGPTALIGDGMTDYKAEKFADLFIGFGGVVFRPQLKKLCRFYIEEPRLQRVLDIVL